MPLANALCGEKLSEWSSSGEGLDMMSNVRLTNSDLSPGLPSPKPKLIILGKRGTNPCKACERKEFVIVNQD